MALNKGSDVCHNTAGVKIFWWLLSNDKIKSYNVNRHLLNKFRQDKMTHGQCIM